MTLRRASVMSDAGSLISHWYSIWAESRPVHPANVQTMPSPARIGVAKHAASMRAANSVLKPLIVPNRYGKSYGKTKQSRHVFVAALQKVAKLFARLRIAIVVSGGCQAGRTFRQFLVKTALIELGHGLAFKLVAFVKE